MLWDFIMNRCVLMLRPVFKNDNPTEKVEKSFRKPLEAIYEYSLGEYQRWIQIWIQVTESGSVARSRQGSIDRIVNSGGPRDPILAVCRSLDQGELYGEIPFSPPGKKIPFSPPRFFWFWNVPILGGDFGILKKYFKVEKLVFSNIFLPKYRFLHLQIETLGSTF